MRRPFAPKRPGVLGPATGAEEWEVIDPTYYFGTQLAHANRCLGEPTTKTKPVEQTKGCVGGGGRGSDNKVYAKKVAMPIVTGKAGYWVQETKLQNLMSTAAAV